MEWSDVSTGPAEGLKCSAAPPADGSDKGAALVEAGLVTRWLVIGPFAVEDAIKDFAKEVIPGEAKLAPREGEKAGELVWKHAEPTSDGVSFQGGDALGQRGKPRQVGYAHTYLHARKAGRVRAVLEHVVGTKVYVNAKEVYSDNPSHGGQRVVMGSAYGLSRNRIANTCATLAARIASTNVFVTRVGEVIRAAAGQMLWQNRQTVDRRDDGCWCSPPVHDGLMYGTDWYGIYYVIDLKARKKLVHKDLGLGGEYTYVSMGVAASPTLVGRNIVVMNNQGLALVLEPGSECEVVARNRLATQIPRDWPITTQEYTGYSPPVADGQRMYLRGERCLYCIGER